MRVPRSALSAGRLCPLIKLSGQQRAEVSRIAADTLEARRKRQAELTSQRKAAAAALQAERTAAIAAKEQKQRQADVEARKIAQEEAQAKLAEGGERWKEVQCRTTL
eukprot:COSAG02_NODE_773_length_17343_cov_61.240373_16_plen_107_part_00